jgi:neutral ceramidase
MQQLISSDNKGYASYLMERHQNGNKTLPGHGKFVAAFASTNLGDVSPNTKGAFCVDTGRLRISECSAILRLLFNSYSRVLSGLPCDYLTSTCSGVAETCVASGPGNDMFQSTEIIGRNQFETALSLLNNNNTKILNGSISFRHSFINMGNVTVALGDGTLVTTCPAALGYAFGSGTTDGSG